MQYGDLELRRLSLCIVRDGVHAGRSVLEVPTTWLSWCLCAAGWRASHPELVEPVAAELRRRLTTQFDAVVTDLRKPSAVALRPKRAPRPPRPKRGSSPARRVAAVRTRLEHLGEEVNALLLDEYRRRGLDLVE